MGKTWYHYNSSGRFTGMTTDTPPGCGCAFMIIIALVLVFALQNC